MLQNVGISAERVVLTAFSARAILTSALVLRWKAHPHALRPCFSPHLRLSEIRPVRIVLAIALTIRRDGLESDGKRRGSVFICRLAAEIRCSKAAYEKQKVDRQSLEWTQVTQIQWISGGGSRNRPQISLGPHYRYAVFLGKST
jgi:hypothetical protein